MTSTNGLEWTFDTAAETYMKLRPGYPKELYEYLFQSCLLSENSHVIEIGIGGGQATLPVLQTGANVTAIEYGAELSKLCREKFKDYSNFSVITGRFEDVELEKAAFDLIFSASAFHWIPEEIGYQKVYSLLKHGGVFARFANHPYEDKGNQKLSDQIQELYKIYMPGSKKPAEYSELAARERAEIALKYGFEDIQYQLFRRTRTFSAKEYIALLGTYSDHIALEERIRKEFFSAIEKVIRENGGKFTIYDTIDLELARKR